MTPPRNQFLTGDALKTLRTLPASSLDMALLSPPYFNLRRYQSGSAELGHEVHIDEWVSNLEYVMTELRRVLVPTGTVWLNLGDAFSLHPRQGTPRKSLLLGPERLALRLVDRGWLLRSSVVWQKRNPMPTSIRDRFASTWEHLFVFAIAPRYYFDLDAVRVPAISRPTGHRQASEATGRAASWRGGNALGTAGLQAMKDAGMVAHPLGRNPGDVLSLASSNYRGTHRATFPLALAERAILAGCPEWRCTRCRRPWQRPLVRAPDSSATRGAPLRTCPCRAGRERGIALDPFMGVGTTALAAQRLNRDWLGIELNPAYVAEARARLATDAPPAAA